MQIETEEPAVCKNKKCSDYQSFEMYEFNDIKTDELFNKDYYVCRGCGEKIYVE